MSWAFRLGLNLSAKFCHVDSEILYLFRADWSPYLPQELTIRDHLTDILDQDHEQAILNGGQVDLSKSNKDPPAT